MSPAPRLGRGSSLISLRGAHHRRDRSESLLIGEDNRASTAFLICGIISHIHSTLPASHVPHQIQRPKMEAAETVITMIIILAVLIVGCQGIK
jgi:hypothetical protein